MEIKKLCCNWQEQKQCFESASEWWEYGKKHIRDFTKIYTRASTAQKKRKNSLLNHLRNTYRKIHTNPNLQYTINNLRSQLYQTELDEEQGVKFTQRFSMSCKVKNAPNSFSPKWKNEKMHNKLCFL